MIGAPYRFIAIDPTVVEPPVAYAELDLSQPHEEGSVSGTIDVGWTAETPICVGQPDKNDKQIVRPMRFGDAYALPGASLRGMLRAVAEIATFSHLGRINGARHYGVRTYETREMPAGHQHRPQDLKAGWLRRENDGWVLRSCEPIRGYDYGYWLVHFDEILAELSRHGTAAPAADEWRQWGLGQKRQALTEARLADRVTLIDDGLYVARFPGGLRKARFEGGRPLTTAERQQRRVPGYLVCSGPTEIPSDDPQRAKIRETVFAPPSARPHDAHPLCRSFIELFHALNSDPGRERREPRGNWRFWLAAMGWLDAFGAERDDRTDPDPAPYNRYPGIPVFFHGDPAVAREDQGPPIAERGFFIGLTRVLRLPWPYSVGEVADRLYRGSQEHRRYAVPRLGEKPGGWDFARALFGEVDDANLDRAVVKERQAAGDDARALAGRVAVGPAFAANDPEPERALKEGVFGTPRESYYPFYLARAGDGGGSQRYDDEDAIPAGRKRYAARRATAPFPAGNDSDRTKSRVQFLPAGTVFRGRIRYRNLHPVELGALLWALTFGTLDGPYRHQLGRAKAYGHGVLRAELGFQPPKIVRRDKIAGDPAAIATYLDAFRAYMDRRVPGGDYERTPQIVALRRMADPAVGEQAAEKGLLATPELEQYQQWKREFSRLAKPLLTPI